MQQRQRILVRLSNTILHTNSTLFYSRHPASCKQKNGAYELQRLLLWLHADGCVNYKIKYSTVNVVKFSVEGSTLQYSYRVWNPHEISQAH
jgi:hypothetical protein